MPSVKRNSRLNFGYELKGYFSIDSVEIIVNIGVAESILLMHNSKVAKYGVGRYVSHEVR